MIHTAVQYGAHVTPEDVVRLVNENGGATISNDWRIAGGGWLVGLQGFEVRMGELTSHAVHAYMSQYTPAFMGLWRNPETGTIFLDSIQIIDDKMTAIELGIANEQLAIYNDLEGEELDLRNWYPNIGLASVRTAAGEVESLGELGTYTFQVQRSRGWASSSPALVAPEETNWVALSSVRLGASVQENAQATIESLLGVNEGNHHVPPRADIQKMKNAYDLWSQGQPGNDKEWGDDNVAAASEWQEKYGLSDQEMGIIIAYQSWYQMAEMDDRGEAHQKAFDKTVRWLMHDPTVMRDRHQGFPQALSEQDAKQVVGRALKRYEQQNYPMLYLAIRKTLDDAYRSDINSYKLWPKMVTWVKDEFDRWLWWENGGFNRPNQSPSALAQLPHIVDITTEGGRLLSELRAEHRIPQGFDANQLRFGDFEQWLMDWKKANRQSEAQGQVVYEFHDGWTIQKLTTPEQLQFEGDEMGHCVGGYGYAGRTERGSTIIYSLRDPKGMPHVTMEIDAIYSDNADEETHKKQEYAHPEDTPSEDPEAFEVKQIMGKGNNTPKPEYQRKVKEFLDALRKKGWHFEKSMDFHRPWDEGAQGDEYNLEDAAEGYGWRNNATRARALDEWYDEYYKTNHKAYRGEHTDAYGLPSEQVRLYVKDWDEVITDCLGALIDEYDPGRWRGRPGDLAQAVYHAYNVSMDSGEIGKAAKEELNKLIENAREKLDEWDMNTWDYAYPHVKDQLAEAIEKSPEYPKIEQELDANEGEGMWDEDELVDWVRDEHEDLWYEAEQEVRDDVQHNYSGDAHLFLQYLYELVNKHGMPGPRGLPDPQQTNGGLPTLPELQEMPWPEEPKEEIPGTFSHVASEWGEDYQIHPIDQEHNVYFDEDGNERPRYRNSWVKNPETGRMEQTGPEEDTFLDRQGRQGQGYVAYQGDRPVGSLTYVDDPAGWYMLGTAYTHPEHRERGVFNRLVAPLRETGKPIDAYVWNNPWLRDKVRGWQKTADFDTDPVNPWRYDETVDPRPPASNEDVWEAQRRADEEMKAKMPPPAIHWISNPSGYEYSRPGAPDYGLPFLWFPDENRVYLGEYPTFHQDIEMAHQYGNSEIDVPYGGSHGRYNHERHQPALHYERQWRDLPPAAQKAIENEIIGRHPTKKYEDEPETESGDWDEMFG